MAWRELDSTARRLAAARGEYYCQACGTLLPESLHCEACIGCRTCGIVVDLATLDRNGDCLDCGSYHPEVK